MIEIFTDGSSKGNPGPGGYSAIIRFENGKEKIIKGGETNTTNNRMEMRAVIEALKTLPKSANTIRVHSDSTLLVSTMTKGWKKKENIDLWKKLEKLALMRKIEWRWIKGHADHKENIRCDLLAVAEAEKMKNKSSLNGTRKKLSFFCGRCEKSVLGILTRSESGAIRADCEHCGKFIKFAKQTKETLARATKKQEKLF